jgi:hypothetical protein
MTREDFTDAVLEQFFVQGVNCQNLPLLSVYADMESVHPGVWPDPRAFALKYRDSPGLTRKAEQLGKFVSPTAGARHKWLAVHEAGHVIVGLKGGLSLKGIRFYDADDKQLGEAGLEDPPWQSSSDENLLRMLIRVDMAGNIAQLVYPGCEPPEGGRLSELYKDRTPGKRASDFCCADARANQLAVVLLNWDRKSPAPERIWEAKRRFLEQGEAEAAEILRGSIGFLDRLAESLMRGPMTGTAARAIVEG